MKNYLKKIYYFLCAKINIIKIIRFFETKLLNLIFNNFFIFLIIFLLLLYYLFEGSLLYLYIRSFIFIIIYIYFKSLNNYFKNVKIFIIKYFKYNSLINKIGLFIYKWSHLYFWWLYINKYVFKLIAKLRYYLLFKKNYFKLMDKIDYIYYFFIYLPIESIFETYINIYYKFKMKLIKYDYKSLIFSKIILLIIIILITTYFFSINMVDLEKISFIFYLKYIFIFFNLIIILKSIPVWLKNRYLNSIEPYNSNRMYLRYDLNGPGYIDDSVILKIYQSRFFLINCNFNIKEKNKKIIKYNFLNDFKHFQGDCLENKYWYNYYLYKKDIYNTVNIQIFKKFEFLLNTIISKFIFWKWHYNLFIKSLKNIKKKEFYLKKKNNQYFFLQTEETLDSDEFLVEYKKKYFKNKKFMKQLESNFYFYKKLLLICKNLLIKLDFICVNYDIVLDCIYTRDTVEYGWYENINFNLKFNKYTYFIFDKIKIKTFENDIQELNIKLTTYLNNVDAPWKFDNYFLYSSSCDVFYTSISSFFLLDEIKKFNLVESDNINEKLQVLSKISSKPVYIKKYYQEVNDFLFPYYCENK